MSYVNCARFAKEQNLVALQVDEEIFYEVCKDIPQVHNYLAVGRFYKKFFLSCSQLFVSLKDGILVPQF